MKFIDLNYDVINYDGKEYRSWMIDVGGGRLVKFADIELLNKFEDEVGGNEANINNDIDDSIGYYAGLNDEVMEAIIEFNN